MSTCRMDTLSMDAIGACDDVVVLLQHDVSVPEQQHVMIMSTCHLGVPSSDTHFWVFLQKWPKRAFLVKP